MYYPTCTHAYRARLASRCCCCLSFRCSLRCCLSSRNLHGGAPHRKRRVVASIQPQHGGYNIQPTYRCCLRIFLSWFLLKGVACASSPFSSCCCCSACNSPFTVCSFGASSTLFSSIFSGSPSLFSTAQEGWHGEAIVDQI